MRFTCEKSILQTSIAITARTVAVKSSIPSLEGILLEANEQLQLTGYNTKTGIRTVVGADIQEPGSIVISSRLFGEIIRRLPDEPVSVSVNGEVVTIRCGVSEFKIMGTDAEEYPALPSVEYQNTITMEQGALMSMLNQTLFAVGHDESRAIQTGELFELNEEGVLTVVAVDGYRLALRREKVQGGKPCSFVIPAASLIEVSKICSDVQEPVDIVQGERHIMFKAGNITLISRRLEGTFLNYRGSIPADNPIAVTADRKQLISAIDRCSLIITEQQKSPLRCNLEGNVLSFQTATALGTVYDECNVVGSGETLEIGFNDRYMLDALKAAPAEVLQLRMNTPVSPCVILPEEGKEENFLYMVLPVRLRSGL
jgi:DNA polymerase-3 subunit beta